MARQIDTMGNVTRFEWDVTDADNVVVVRDGYRGNVLIYSRRGAGDTDNHRYDASLNRKLATLTKTPTSATLRVARSAKSAAEGKEISSTLSDSTVSLAMTRRPTETLLIELEHVRRATGEANGDA